jgi:hypothetical protein
MPSSQHGVFAKDSYFCVYREPSSPVSTTQHKSLSSTRSARGTVVPKPVRPPRPLAAYPDTLTVLRWRGLRTVMHDVTAAQRGCGARIAGQPE